MIGTTSALALPTLAAASIPSKSTSLPEFKSALSAFVPNEEKYWEMVKKQFTTDENLTVVNAANLCPSPYFVSEKATALLQKLQSNVSFQNRSVFSEEREIALTKLASYLNCTQPEVGITRNTSEANNIVVHGLDLGKGDEVVLWEQNHPSNGTSWEEQAKRFGFKIVWVKLPSNPSSKEELIKPFAEAINKNTRVLTFSHISNVSGIALPAKELCVLAREKEVLSLVDGAQSFGMLAIDVKDLACDFYTGSTHKWLMGPLENGIIYMKTEMIDKVWPSIITAGWKPDSNTVDEKFCKLGQRNETTASAISDILDFHLSIGKVQVEERVRELNSYLKGKLVQKLKNIEFVTPISSELSGGVTILKILGKEPREVFAKLYQDFGIACAPTGGLRLSPNIYNTKSDIDRVVEALVQIEKG
ncbi:aminotransferase class V-fold PLP-dependent enzyme [Flammeovirgaceae bacterium SG7u.111]|nr:aminotransferase class V-fold PLP-dependent enzyme [Flammeovirgaceae bacterium SG7u.132]WPO36250.1 aminotransferase class V-fold PLP-dependent enzyme [Flammeovirgaceae bacterium SG7u.111]